MEGDEASTPPPPPWMQNSSLMARTTDAVPSASSTVFSTYTTPLVVPVPAPELLQQLLVPRLASSRPPIPTQFRSLNRTTVSDMVPVSGIRAAYASASRSSAPPRK
ncbi:hypothetical protein Zm00014a_006768 [Zea mays]|uniref:Uncharacterized protein n=2 Tax=Zea mays TaxID=4577 RepID=A0A3L6FTV4_MAIZE|nr:hypothetical protein Zm00014a_036738 [Zea mays]PWZ12468.1 hypothetical protein Zm00014a_003263 [Zea mays]PWZ17327.1 hypothetical protein Zm00014a_038584 [Zea mays]PWZ18953.1 hypothetical protein Zm00014a_023917 [Zea mays]PWZ26987.1 hypothetical protein Zm00014a_041162 [Zea mays]